MSRFYAVVTLIIEADTEDEVAEVIDSALVGAQEFEPTIEDFFLDEVGAEETLEDEFESDDAAQFERARSGRVPAPAAEEAEPRLPLVRKGSSKIPKG